MNSRISTTALLMIGALLLCGRALADCPLGSAYDKGIAYQKGQALEKQGKKAEALELYVETQGEVCDPTNPYEEGAAKRAAPIGLELGSAAEKAGDFRKAQDFYGMGGHFALADKAMMHSVRQEKDGPNVYVNAREHFEARARIAAAKKPSAALKAAGPYSLDPKLVAEVDAMPKQAIDRASAREIKGFNEAFLREFVQLLTTRSDDLTDMAALHRTSAAQTAFSQKWSHESYLQNSEEALELMRRWSKVTDDAALAKATEAQVAQRAEHHAQTIVQKYSGAAALLTNAITFVELIGLDDAKQAARVTAIKAQASKLGDEANAKARYLAAMEYYQVSGEKAKGEAIQAKVQQQAMQKMQPGIDKALKQAEEMQKQFGDPAKVQAMREQAEAARKAMQQQQSQANAKSASNKKSAEDLEKELGL